MSYATHRDNVISETSQSTTSPEPPVEHEAASHPFLSTHIHTWPSHKQNMDYFTKLPHEVLHNVLKDVEPLDLATLSTCCGDLHRFISDNRPLFKELYLTRLVSWIWDGNGLGKNRD